MNSTSLTHKIKVLSCNHNITLTPITTVLKPVPSLCAVCDWVTVRNHVLEIEMTQQKTGSVRRVPSGASFKT